MSMTMSERNTKETTMKTVETKTVRDQVAEGVFMAFDLVGTLGKIAIDLAMLSMATGGLAWLLS